jgi:hypothetical protein
MIMIENIEKSSEEIVNIELENIENNKDLDYVDKYVNSVLFSGLNELAGFFN